jgi:hypothetical protein
MATYNLETITEKNITLSFEFERYVLENPEILEQIPQGAEIVLLPKDDPELYRINLESAQTAQNQTEDFAAKPYVIYIEIEALAPPRSRLINPHLTLQPSPF